MTLQQMVTKHNFVYLQSAAVAAAALHRATEIATGTAPAAPPPPALVQQAILTRTASIVTGSPEAPPTVALVREAILTRRVGRAHGGGAPTPRETSGHTRPQLRTTSAKIRAKVEPIQPKERFSLLVL